MVGLHPLWSIAIADLAISDYENSPWSHHFRIAPAIVDDSVLGGEHPSEQDAILRARTQFFDSLSNMSELKQSQHIVAVRNNFEPGLKLAVQLSRHCKLACTYLLELQNCLRLIDMNTPSLAIKMSAVDSSLSRNAIFWALIWQTVLEECNKNGNQTIHWWLEKEKGV